MKKLVKVPFKLGRKGRSSMVEIIRTKRMIKLENRRLESFKIGQSFLLVLFVRGKITLRKIIDLKGSLCTIVVFAIEMVILKIIVETSKGKTKEFNNNQPNYHLLNKPMLLRINFKEGKQVCLWPLNQIWSITNRHGLLTVAALATWQRRRLFSLN